MAVQLNELGHRNYRGEAFTPKKIILVCQTYLLKSRLRRQRARGMLTGVEVPEQLGISTATVHELGRQGVLLRHMDGNNY